MATSERLEYMKQYLAKQEKVKVEMLPHIVTTTKGKVIKRFNDTRCGYKFKDGIAYVEQADLQKFKDNFPHVIIHDETVKDGEK